MFIVTHGPALVACQECLYNRIILDYLVAEKGGIYAIINNTSWTYVTNSHVVELCIKEVYG